MSKRRAKSLQNWSKDGRSDATFATMLGQDMPLPRRTKEMLTKIVWQVPFLNTFRTLFPRF
jgi:hypothetical protein